MMKKIIHISIFCFWLSGTVFAQTADDENSADQQEQTEQDADNENPQQAPEAMPDIGLIEEENILIEDDENFVPSVRITEDLPVAFPVDI